MNTSELLIDAFGRIADAVHGACEDLDAADLAWRADPAANSIAWLVWHLARVQDDHVSAVAGREQVYTALGWYHRFGLPFPADAIGYGFTPEQVGLVQVASPDLLTGYYDAVHQATAEFVAGLSDSDLDRVVDSSWDPPVTLGVRLVSVANDDLQHAGQAAFLRGLVERRRG
jgi:uncharacterized damage-inducible protein DinB